MTRIDDHEPPRQRRRQGTPRWLVIAITSLAFSVPVAGLPLLAWPLPLQETDIIIGYVELTCFAGVTLLIGWVLASYALRERPPRL